MTFLIHRSEKQLKHEEKVTVEQPKKCSKNLKIAAIVFAWASLVIPSLYSADVIYGLISYHEFNHSLTIYDLLLFIFAVLMNLTFLGITIVNIYAVHKDVPKYMRPWLVYTAFGIVFNIISIIMHAPSASMTLQSYRSDEMIFMGLRVLSFVIIYNYFTNIKSGPSSHVHTSLLKVGAISSAWIAAVMPFCLFLALGCDLVNKVLNDVFVYDRFTFSSIAASLVVMVFLTVTLGLSIANIYGVHKDNLRCIAPWLIFTAFAIAFCMISAILNYISIEIITENNLLFIFIAVVHSICFIFEYKHFRKIKSDLYRGYALDV